jgi:hypothetical protein
VLTDPDGLRVQTAQTDESHRASPMQHQATDNPVSSEDN